MTLSSVWIPVRTQSWRWLCVFPWRSSGSGRRRRPGAAAASAAEAGVPTPSADESEDALLKMSVSQPESGSAALPDFSSMTEEEQIAYAMQMSLAGGEYGEMDTGAPMDTAESAKEEDDYDVMQDPEFLQSVLENLPGVDPNNEAIRNAMGSLASQTGNKPDDKKEEEKEMMGGARKEHLRGMSFRMLMLHDSSQRPETTTDGFSSLSDDVRW
ncbi:26S proteasome non-ATPase regulatory subunit 4 [Oryzias melastigma]|uniref:26S proteasome non-ATPase regulatory subunit 4 n=1 Tax=Oryzias melastigma TaxID=30732 RepID=A0A834BPR2_ORYME|nr:26S proteasome non-ATPase regulatory subunit 4 [Oryzias melastigma]